jgi:hypothetical protein
MVVVRPIEAWFLGVDRKRTGHVRKDGCSLSLDRAFAYSTRRPHWLVGCRRFKPGIMLDKYK